MPTRRETPAARNRRRHLQDEMARAGTPRDRARAAFNVLLAQAIRTDRVGDLTNIMIEMFDELNAEPSAGRDHLRLESRAA